MPAQNPYGIHHEAGALLRLLRGDRSLRALRDDHAQAFEDTPSHTTIAKWEWGHGITREVLARYVMAEALDDEDADRLYESAGLIREWTPAPFPPVD